MDIATRNVLFGGNEVCSTNKKDLESQLLIALKNEDEEVKTSDYSKSLLLAFNKQLGGK